MAKIWDASVITNKGLILQSKTMAGGTIKITSIKTGAGKVGDDQLLSQTDVSDIKQTASIQQISVKNNHSIVNAMLSNKGLTEAHDIFQIGLYANDPDDGEILYAILQSSTGKHIPSEAEMPGYSVEFDFYFAMINGVGMSFEVVPVGVVSMKMFKALEKEVSTLYLTKAIRSESAVITDSAELPFVCFRLLGRCEQGANPSKDNPQDIVVGGDSGSVDIVIYDGFVDDHAGTQTITVSTPNGLPGIQVTDASLATYTDDNGVMWCADEVDFESGKYIQRIGKLNTLTDDYNLVMMGINNPNGIVYALPLENAKKGNVLWTTRTCKSSDDILNFSASDFCIETTSSGTAIYFVSERSITGTQAKEELQAENSTLYYFLSEPVETDLSSDVIDAYKDFHTNNPNTTVTNDSGVLMDFEYVHKNYERAVGSLMKKLDKLNGMFQDYTEIPLDEFFKSQIATLNEDEENKLYRKGNHIYGRLFFSGSITTSTAGAYQVGIVNDEYKPKITQTGGTRVNALTNGQQNKSASYLIAGTTGRFYVYPGEANTSYGSDEYPWCTNDGFVFDYEL